MNLIGYIVIALLVVIIAAATTLFFSRKRKAKEQASTQAQAAVDTGLKEFFPNHTTDLTKAIREYMATQPESSYEASPIAAQEPAPHCVVESAEDFGPGVISKQSAVEVFDDFMTILRVMHVGSDAAHVSSSTPRPRGLAKDLLEVYKLSTLDLKTTEPQGFWMPGKNSGAIVFAVAPKRNIVMWKELGKVMYACYLGSTFVAKEVHLEQGYVCEDPQQATLRTMLRRKYSELIEVRQYLINPEHAYIMETNSVALCYPNPANFKKVDQAEMGDVFEFALGEVPAVKKVFLARTVLGFYSEAILRRIQGPAVSVTRHLENGAKEHYLILKSRETGLNVVIGRRTQGQKVYFQLAYPVESSIIAGKNFPEIAIELYDVNSQEHGRLLKATVLPQLLQEYNEQAQA